MEGVVPFLVRALAAVAVFNAICLPIALAIVFRGLERTQVSGGTPLRQVEIENKRLLEQLAVHREEQAAKRERTAFVHKIKERRQREAMNG